MLASVARGCYWYVGKFVLSAMWVNCLLCTVGLGLCLWRKVVCGYPVEIT